MPGADDLRLERHAQPDVHVGRPQLGSARRSGAEIMTPDSACMALRVEATRDGGLELCKQIGGRGRASSMARKDSQK